MKLVNVDELSGAVLDFVVSRCQYPNVPAILPYSNDWAFAGDLLAPNKIVLDYLPDNGYRAYIRSKDIIVDSWKFDQLTVAMQCYVISQVGYTTQIPDDLTNEKAN